MKKVRNITDEALLKSIKLIRGIKGVIVVEGQKNWIKLIKGLFPEASRHDFKFGFSCIYQYNRLQILFTEKLEIENQTVLKLK